MTTDAMATLPPRFVRWNPIARPDGKIDKVPCDLYGFPIDPHNPVACPH